MPPSKPVSKEDTELKDPDSKAAKKKAKEAGKAGGAENPAAWAMLGYGSSLFGAGLRGAYESPVIRNPGVA